MIKFTKLRWKNFLSTGNHFNEINLNSSPNTLFVGKNGSGKSTLLDALCFALFGKTYRKINKPTIINSINGSQGLVEVEFEIGDKQYKIVRGLKPNKFEIYVNNELLNQEAASRDYQEFLENSVLKLNFKSFTQIVILGSASFTPFMQLTAADRRNIIEDLLDIGIFSTMNVLVKAKISNLKEVLTENHYNILMVDQKIELQLQNLDDHSEKNKKEIGNKLSLIKETEDNINIMKTDIDLVQKHINSMIGTITDKDNLDTRHRKMNTFKSTIESNIIKITKEIAFYNDNDHCPTCKQMIEESFKKDVIEKHNHNINEQKNGLSDLELKIIDANIRLQYIKEIQEKIDKHESEIIKNTSTIKASEKFITRLKDEIAVLENDQTNLHVDNSKLKVMNEEKASLELLKEKYVTERHYYEFASTLLKDTGIKTKIISQYLPVMNKLINKYLASMDSFINFNLDESFNEVIKSRHRDEFSYNNFSEGEKLRIDLAILFTWRQIAKLKNSVNTNLLILDEIFDSSLDVEGTENFLKIMYEIAEDTNVFVISHKNDQLFDKFNTIIKFEKINNFSRIF